MKEWEVQEIGVAYARHKYPHINVYHIQNNAGSMRTALRYKRMGVTVGVPDLVITNCSTSPHYCGAVIEVKRQRYAVLGPSQKHQLSVHAKHNKYVAIAYGVLGVQQAIDDYMSMVPCE